MNVQQTVLVRVRGQCHFGEVDRGDRGTVVRVRDQFFGDLDTNVLLGFQGRTTDMRRQNHVIQAAQRALELFIVAFRLNREDVDGRPIEFSCFNGIRQRLDFHHAATGGIDQDSAILHGGDLFRANHPAGRGQVRHVQADHVRTIQQLLQAGDLAGITHTQLSDHIVVNHVEAERLCQYRELCADTAVTHDTEGFTARFVGVFRRLQPAALVRASILLGNTAQQHNGFCQYQLRH